MRYRFIREQHEWHSVNTLCRVMKVSRSGYYQWLSRKPCARELEDRRLWPKIEALHYRRREAYGAVRLRDDLRELGERCSAHRIARLKRANRLWTKRRRRFVLTTKADAGHARYPNLLDRQFHVEAPDRVWVADVTSVWTMQGWLYLAVVLCLYSRRVVGWSMSARNGEALTMAALEMALQFREPEPGLLHHSDRGTHYASQRYRQLLKAHGAESSMSGTGNCYDNAVAESFFSTLKNELTLHERYETRDQARASIFDYIEVFYNRERRHSYIGSRSPADFERRGSSLTGCL
jgi:transposase InsO family protein